MLIAEDNIYYMYMYLTAVSFQLNPNVLRCRVTCVKVQFCILNVRTVCALYSGDCSPHQHDCVLRVGIEGVAGNELCSLLPGVIADSPFHRVQRGVHRVAVHLSTGGNRKGGGGGGGEDGEGREERRGMEERM